MPAKKSLSELARVGRSPGHDSGGRVIGANRAPQACKWLERMQAKPIPPDLRELYDEAIARIDIDIPHYDGYHEANPAKVNLEDIEAVEGALASVGIKIDVSGIYRLIEQQEALNA
jgi:hypothetical protein